MDHGSRLYTQFLYKKENIGEDRGLETLIAEAGISRNVLIDDLSSLSPSEVIFELNSAIAAERTRLFYPGDPEYLLNVYRIEEKTYFFILSVSGSFMEDQKKTFRLMCVKLFGCFPEESDSIISCPPSYIRESVNYWSNLFGILNPDQFKGTPRSSSGLEMASFRVPDEVEAAFDSYVENDGSGSALCAAVLGQMTSHMLESPQVIVNQILTGTPLSGAPIILKNSFDFKASLQEVISQFKNVSTNCFCTRDQLYQAIGNRFINRVMISSGYADPNMYTNLIRRIKPGVCYMQPAIDTLNSPLCVYTKRFGGEMNIIYIYDPQLFANVDMAKFHESVCRLFGKALNIREDAEVDIYEDSFGLEEKENEKEKESKKEGKNLLTPTEQAQIKALKSIRAFSGYNEGELTSLLKDVTFSLRNSKQYILSYGDRADRIYFVCNGRVSVMGTDIDGFVNPIYIAKPGDAFGFESLTHDPVLKSTYRAFSEDVILVSLDSKVLLRESTRHPEILQYLLDRQVEIAYRLQKLWMTV